jgi:hypothetical protein
MYEALVSAGIVDRATTRRYLGRGTHEYSNVAGPVKCWEVNPSAMRNVFGDTPLAELLNIAANGITNSAGSADTADRTGARN